MAQEKRSWLDGPQIAGEHDDPHAPGKWPGERIGLPETGSGAQASVARRAGAVMIDWVVASIIANFLVSFTSLHIGRAGTPLLVWFIMGVLCGWLFARTPGMAILGMGVARIDVPGAQVGLWRAAVRTLLTAFVLPAAMVDTDGRGMHDRATGTTVIRS